MERRPWPAQLAVFPLQACSKLLLVVQRVTAPVIIGLCLACVLVQYSNWTFRTRSTHNRRDITIPSSLGQLLSSSTISHMPTKQFTAGSSLLDSTATKRPRHLSSESRENRFLTRLANSEVHARTTTTLREDNQRIILYLGKLPSSLGKIQERLLGAEFDSDDTRSTSERSESCTTQNNCFLKERQALEVRAESLKQDARDQRVPKAVWANQSPKSTGNHGLLGFWRFENSNFLAIEARSRLSAAIL